MTFDGLVSLVVNLGVSAAAAIALIWFLFTLVSKTLPGMMAMFREELTAERLAHEVLMKAERDYRLAERMELLRAVAETHAARAQEHVKIMDRLDYGFKNLLDEVEALRVQCETRQSRGNGG